MNLNLECYNFEKTSILQILYKPFAINIIYNQRIRKFGGSFQEKQIFKFNFFGNNQLE